MCSVTLIVLTIDEIDGMTEVMPQVQNDWVDEIVVVDGGSTDGTIEKSKELGYRVIHQHDKGEGNACRLGVRETKSDYVIFFSPDGNDLAEDIPKLVKKCNEGHKVAHISRFGKKSVSDDAGFIDKFGNNMFTFLFNAFFGGNYTDALNGFRIIKRSIWDKLKTDAQYLNIEQQTCIRLAKLKIPIYEIEGNEPARIGGERKMRPLTTGAQLSYQILKEFAYWKF